jgi:hypothetical protein
MSYVTVHRDGRLVACLHASSEGLVKLKSPPKKGEHVTLTVLHPPRLEPEPA